MIRAHLAHLASALGLPAAGTGGPIETVASVLGPWADHPVEAFDRGRSFVANNGLPVEFSFSASRTAAAARVLFDPEPSADPQGAAATAPSGRSFPQRLARSAQVDVSRLRTIEALFAERPEPDLFSAFYSAVVDARPGGPLFKVYLNPAAPTRPAVEVVAAAMNRLGLGEQWARLWPRLADGRHPAAEDGRDIAFFGLDLGGSPEARVKVYLRQPERDAEAIEAVAVTAADHRPGWFTRILRQQYGDGIAGLAKAPVVCLSFQGDEAAPVSATLHCPLEPNVPDDAAAVARIGATVKDLEIDPTVFQKAFELVCGPWPATTNRLSWVSFKRPADPVITVYAGLSGATTPTYAA